MITHKFDYKSFSRATENGKRLYATPDGLKLPSVTTILESTKPQEAREGLERWRKRVGHAKAKEITTESANRGTRMHTYLEHYVLTGDMKELPSNPFAQPSWYMAAEVILNGLSNVDEFWGSEISLYYPGLYAGTTDLAGIWKKKEAILDYKQTNKPKKREWVGDYFMQLCAYAAAHNAVYNTNIGTGVVLMCVQPKADETPEYQEFSIEGAEFEYWTEEWNKRVEAYYKLDK